MKIEDCIDKQDGFACYDMKKIQDCIKARDKEFLEDLKLKLSVSSHPRDCITSMMIGELLDE